MILIRIGGGPGGLSLAFAPRPSPGDEQVDPGESCLYVAANAVAALADRMLDSQSSHGGRPTLVLCPAAQPEPAPAG